MLRLPSFLVTLATMGLVAGRRATVTDLKSVAVTDQTFADVVRLRRRRADPGPDPLDARRRRSSATSSTATARFGAHVLAVGDNAAAAARDAASASIASSSPCSWSAATAAALAGLLYAGRLQGASYTLGESDLLIVIAAVVIGGTRLFGGSGSVSARSSAA